VLEALVEAGEPVESGCRRGTCLTCVRRAGRGEIPTNAQQGLRKTLAERGWFLSCQCRPDSDLWLVNETPVSYKTTLTRREVVQPGLVELNLTLPADFDYEAGMFVHVLGPSGARRAYSLASVPGIDDDLQLHVRHHAGGRVSPWLCNHIEVGDSLELQGPFGACVYSQGNEDQPLLMLAWGTGAGPLLGVARAALQAGHRGPIHFRHVSRGSHVQTRLHALAQRHPNFRHWIGPQAHVLDGLQKLRGWRVFACGAAERVHAARREAYLRGARLDEIMGDAFESQAI
jgi:ferredoxin-NADP reductase